MTSIADYTDLVTDVNMQEFFAHSLANALDNQNVQADTDTVHYLVNLLADYARADVLFLQTLDGPTLQPLASLYAEALDAPSAAERIRILRRLGDVALFIAGIFSDSLNRSLVDVDYYIAMGGGAYNELSDCAQISRRIRPFGSIFRELAAKFQAFVDVLGEVTEGTHLSSNSDVLRLYEVWVRTGSERAAKRLRGLGIEPLHGTVSRSRH